MPFLPDIGIGELLLVAIVALFVVGPERLPVVMEKLGLAFANVRHFVQGMTAGWGLTDNEEEMVGLKKKTPKPSQKPDAVKTTSDE